MIFWVQRRHNCSPAASFANCIITLYLFKVHLQTFLSIPVTQKCQNLSCDNLVTHERCCWWVAFPTVLQMQRLFSALSSAKRCSLLLCFIEWISTSIFVFDAFKKLFYLVIFLLLVFHKYLELNRSSTLKMDSIVFDSLWVFLLIMSPSFCITPEAAGFKITLMMPLLNWTNDLC